MKTVKAIYTNDMAIEIAEHPKYGYAVAAVSGEAVVSAKFYRSYSDASSCFDTYLDKYFYKNHLNG